MTDRKPQSLDELLAQFPQDVEPPQTVWHGVVFGIARRRQNTRIWAMAASVACAVLAGALLWAVMHTRPEPQGAAPMMAARAVSFAEPSDAKYTATRAVLETTFRERLGMLDPATRAHIEASLAVIRHAHEDIRKALAAAPANPVLEQLFESTWHDEFDLYDQVVRATQPSMART